MEQGAVLNTPDSMNQAVNLAPSDEQVQLLAALNSTDRFTALEQGFLSENRSKVWYLALLDEYSKSKGLTEAQKLRKAELLRICILKGYYTQSSVMPKDLAADKDDFAKMLGDFRKDIVSIKYYALAARAGEDHGQAHRAQLAQVPASVAAF
jgi:hypothetical protein